jgi:hypothetical protein
MTDELSAARIAKLGDAIGWTAAADVEAMSEHGSHLLVRRQPLSEIAAGAHRRPGDQRDQLRVPVNQLRFTHDRIKSRFGSGASIYETLEQLQLGKLHPFDLPPLDVCEHNGKWWSMSNRRLYVLLLYQAVRPDRVVYVMCTFRWKDWKKGKFLKKLSTTAAMGLGLVYMREPTVQQFTLMFLARQWITLLPDAVHSKSYVRTVSRMWGMNSAQNVNGSWTCIL